MPRQSDSQADGVVSVSGTERGHDTRPGRACGPDGPENYDSDRLILWRENCESARQERNKAEAEVERLRAVIREAHLLLCQREVDRARPLLSSSINLYGEHLARALPDVSR